MIKSFEMIKAIGKTSIILGFILGIFLTPLNAFAESFVLSDGFSYEDIPAEVQEFMIGKSY